MNKNLHRHISVKGRFLHSYAPLPFHLLFLPSYRFGSWKTRHERCRDGNLNISFGDGCEVVFCFLPILMLFVTLCLVSHSAWEGPWRLREEEVDSSFWVHMHYSSLTLVWEGKGLLAFPRPFASMLRSVICAYHFFLATGRLFIIDLNWFMNYVKAFGSALTYILHDFHSNFNVTNATFQSETEIMTFALKLV